MRLQLALCLASVTIAVVFLTMTQDSWLRTMGGILLLFIALVQVSLVIRGSLTVRSK